MEKFLDPDAPSGFAYDYRLRVKPFQPPEFFLPGHFLSSVTSLSIPIVGLPPPPPALLLAALQCLHPKPTGLVDSNLSLQCQSGYNGRRSEIHEATSTHTVSSLTDSDHVGDGYPACQDECTLNVASSAVTQHTNAFNTNPTSQIQGTGGVAPTVPTLHSLPGRWLRPANQHIPKECTFIKPCGDIHWVNNKASYPVLSHDWQSSDGKNVPIRTCCDVPTGGDIVKRSLQSCVRLCDQQETRTNQSRFQVTRTSNKLLNPEAIISSASTYSDSGVTAKHLGQLEKHALIQILHNNRINLANTSTMVATSSSRIAYNEQNAKGNLPSAHADSCNDAPEGYACDYCGKVFAYRYYRDKHLKYTRCVDQGDRKYPCKLCSRSFEKRDRLRIHVLHVHEKHRPHKCHLCDKSFSQSSSLNKHLRVHSGERPYKCCYCQKAFTASSILRTHIRQHSGEKPFKCKFCLKPFASHAAHDSHVRRTHLKLPTNAKVRCPRLQSCVAGTASDEKTEFERSTPVWRL